MLKLIFSQFSERGSVCFTGLPQSLFRSEIRGYSINIIMTAHFGTAAISERNNWNASKKADMFFIPSALMIFGHTNRLFSILLSLTSVLPIKSFHDMCVDTPQNSDLTKKIMSK